MTSWLSRPIESLLAEHRYPFLAKEQQQNFFLETDVLVVGSGYGAAMASLALMEAQADLAQADRKAVWIFERGAEYLPDDFPKSMADMPGYTGLNDVNTNALWDVRAGEGVVTITGRGLGGTSLVNANVAARPDSAAFRHWPQGDGNSSWEESLQPAIRKIETLLGVNRHPEPTAFGRYRAMSATASALDAEARAAPLTVNFNGPTANSTDHDACNLCGNCMIGCHSGAKGSLNMNAWPLIRQLGAEIYAGVIVRSLARAEDGRWQVMCAPAGSPDEVIMVRCQKVILGAGTLGSTEILMRSQGLHDLGLSAALGSGFSTNGDALVFSIGQSAAVGPVASPPGQQPPATEPGPTIMGMASVPLPGGTDGECFTLEDAVIPYPLRQVWQELLVSQNLLRRFADGAESAWHQGNATHDVLAISDSLAEHSQALLLMGHDDSSGHLRFEHDRLKPVWARSGKADYFERLDQTLRSNESKNFAGGVYSPNILSQPLPPGFDGIVEGADDIAGQLLSVHPLGGCAMADDIADGVVNTRGQVFSTKQKTGVFEDLYVLDGAIVPGAIGTNPFLTIAALSYRLAADILSDNPDAVISRPLPALRAPFRKFPSGAVHPVPVASEQKVSAEFKERLVLHLDHGKRSFFPWSRRSGTAPQVLSYFRKHVRDIALPADSKALVLDARFRFSGSNSLDVWLQKPQTPLQAQAVLSADTVGGVLTSEDQHLTPLLDLQGRVTLGHTETVGQISVAWRTASAILRYLHYRTMDALVKIPDSLAAWLLPARTHRIRASRVAAGKTAPWYRQARVFWRIAGLQAQRRYLVYEFSGDNGLRISGRKTLAYGLGAQDLLRALMVLPVEFRSATDKKLSAELELDAVRVTHGSTPLQILKSPDSSATLLAAGGLGMYFLRMIMHTHFWSFAAPSYRHFATRNELEGEGRHGRFFAPPEFMYYGKGGQLKSLPKETHEYSVQQADGVSNLSRLVRYQPSTGDTAARKSLLLVHGLAHSSRVFWTDTIECNFVQYFLAHNYDVWIHDHRASANYIRELAPEHSWDSIALNDVPWAIRTAFDAVNKDVDEENQQGIHVFSHCIGAGAVAMAVLAGKLNRPAAPGGNGETGRSMLASLVPHAVTPWLVTSGENRARANMWALVKDLEPIRIIEPMPYREPELMETLYDRLAALAMTADERRQWSAWKGYRDWRGPGFAQSIYTRYTIFWGRQWHNANISDDTRYEFAGMIGPVPIGVMQQVYFSLTRGLLSNHDGANEYVREENFDRHWTFPTYFLHGNRNTVFDMESSRQSADKLTRLRRRTRTGQYHTGTLDPMDYAAENIWIDVLDDYGHMDMIFSKTGAQDVYPRLHDFFCAAADDVLHSVYQQRYRDPAQREAFASRCRSNSHVRPPVEPLTGPIISRPQVREDDNGNRTLTVRLWVEAQDFTAMAATGLGMHSAHVCPDRLTPLRQTPLWQKRPGARSEPEVANAFAHADSPRNWQQEFWLYDFAFDPEPAQAYRLSLNYEHEASIDTYAGLSSNAVDEGALLAWHGLPWFERVTRRQSTDPLPVLTVLAGSCLYPGLPFERNQAMQIFNGMEAHVRDNDSGSLRGADCMVLLGDQIYADATADLFDPKAYYEKFRNPYRVAFGSPAAQRLMSHLPSYFAVDDHEYRDNWRGDGSPPEPGYDYARRMAWLFQMHHQSELDEANLRLWYNFESAGYPFFVFDTRLHRHNGHGEKTRLLGAEQIKGFTLWLQEQTDSPVLFLATGSPLAPVPRSVCSDPATAVYQDSLLAYPKFLTVITELLHEYTRGKRIIWLCGDPHFSCFAQINLNVSSAAGEKSVRLTQVCASGLYAPMTFINANINDYDWHRDFEVPLTIPPPLHTTEDPDDATQMAVPQISVSGRQVLLSNNKQHFVRLDLDPVQANRLRLQAFGADGEAVGSAW
ncbi:MAG: GMC family oxidoreductase N-terminal domain-containing protein, partial [Pseudohongiella sp.]